MAKQVKRRRGTASEHAVFTSGAHGEVTVSLPDETVSASDRLTNPAELYVHYGDNTAGERFLSRLATIDLIREQIDRQVFLAKITGYVPITTDEPDTSGGNDANQNATDSKTNTNRWMYEWEEVALHTPVSQQIQIVPVYPSTGTFSSTDIVFTFKLPIGKYTNGGATNEAKDATDSSYDFDLVEFKYTQNHGLDGGNLADTANQQAVASKFVVDWNAISASGSGAAGLPSNSSGTSTRRFHTASVASNGKDIILTRNMAENVPVPDANYTSTISQTSGSQLSGISMSVLDAGNETSGKYNPQLNESGEWASGTLPTLDGLFMHYGVTTQSPALSSTLARDWKTVDPTSGGKNGTGYFYALNTTEFSNFYVSSTTGAASDGYGIAGAGMSLTDSSNEQAKHNTDHIREVKSPSGASSTTTSEVYGKKSFPANYSIEPIAPGTVVVMHEKWQASLPTGEANYSGLTPPGGIGAAATYDGTSIHAAPSLDGTKYTPSPPYYYFSMPNVFQGTCG